MTINWTKVARRDVELRQTSDNASEALAKLRWENTHGAIPKKVSCAEYARQCGVRREAVLRYAKAWEMMISDHHLSISDALVKASTSTERAEVIEAMAEARGVTPKAIQAHHTTEIKRVEYYAKQNAAKRGTTVREEAEAFVEFATKARQTERAEKAEKAARTDFRWIEIEANLDKARRALEAALRVEVYSLDDEHKTLIGETLGRLRATLNFVESKFVDMADIDWDAEMVRLNGGRS